jgi:hypothetical protein
LISAQAQAPANSAPWRLEFGLSGGFAGMNKNLELTSNGSATALDCRKRIEAAGTATADELKQIRSFFSASIPEISRNTRCKDCIEYSVDFQMGNKPVKLRFNDLAPGPLQDIVATLTKVIDRVLMNSTKPAADSALKKC